MMASDSRKRPMSEINVVPYIDVMLVLLVIFMITAPLLTQGVKIDLPDAPAEAVEAADTEPLIVSVDSAGRYFINFGGDEAEPVDQATLLNRAAALLRHRPGIQVLVQGDESVEYGAVVVAMAILKEAGARSVGLLTEQPSPAG